MKDKRRKEKFPYITNQATLSLKRGTRRSYRLSEIGLSTFQAKTTLVSPYIWRARPLVSSAPGNPAVTCSSCPSSRTCSLQWGQPSHGSPAEICSLVPPSRGGPALPDLSAPPRGRPGPAARCPLPARRSRGACRRVSAQAVPPARLQHGRPLGSLTLLRDGPLLCPLHAFFAVPRPSVPGS